MIHKTQLLTSLKPQSEEPKILVDKIDSIQKLITVRRELKPATGSELHRLERALLV